MSDPGDSISFLQPNSSIKSIDRSKQFVSDIMKMFHDGSLNDVCIKLHDGEIKANKSVLAARCDYFAATFRWKSNNNHDVEEIVVNDCSKKIMTRIMKYLFSGILEIDCLSLLELLQLKDQVRKLLPGEKLEEVLEEYLNSSGSDIFTNSVQDRCNFFPTNEEIVKTLSLVESGNLQMLDPMELEEIIDLSTNCENKIASLASLVYHGMIHGPASLSLYSDSYARGSAGSRGQLDLGFVPGDHLKALIPSVTGYIEITNISGFDLTGLLDSVNCIMLSLTQNMNQEETNALVRAMSTRADTVYLGSSEGVTSLDVDTLTQYKGDGKCNAIYCYLPNRNKWIGKERTEQWARMMDWSIKKETWDHEVEMIELKSTKTFDCDCH